MRQGTQLLKSNGHLVGALIAAAVCWGCGGSDDRVVSDKAPPKRSDPVDAGTLDHGPNLTSRPLAPGGTHAESTLFEPLAPESTGVDHVNRLDLSHPLKRLYYGGYACGGVSLGDLNGDGRVDLYLVSGPGRNRLYLQQSDWKFYDATASAGVDGGEAWGASAALADIDNDGDLDIYVCNYDSPNQLFINNGQGLFGERAKQWGLDIQDSSITPALCDYDRDGDLDLYLLTHRYYREGGRPNRPPVGISNGEAYILPEFQKYYGLKMKGPKDYQVDTIGRPDRLLRNDGASQGFTDVTLVAGIHGVGHGYSAVWWDYDRDGNFDLYVGNDFADPDHLYHNNGDGTFTDVIASAVPHTSWFSMGADFADLNGDGHLDLLTADMSSTTHFSQKTTMGAMSAAKLASVAGPPQQIMKNSLYLGTGTGRFLEGAELAGLADTDWTWAVKFSDFDCDGRVDCYFSNGISRNSSHSDRTITEEQMIGRTEWSYYENTPPRLEKNLAYRNRGDLKFEDVGAAWGLDHLGMSYAAATGDLDRDGDLDLVVANLDEPVMLYRNRSDSGHRILIRLVGTASNRYGIGAEVELQSSEGNQLRQLSPMTGFLSSNDPRIHFGLGSAQRVTRLSIRWPSGIEQTFEDLPTDRFYTATEPNEESESKPSAVPRDTMFQESNELAGISHREEIFDDFSRQPLLPNKLTQLGPGIAVGDVNGDGRDDIFVGGAAGAEGQLLISVDKAGFEKKRLPAWEDDKAAEDMGVLFFDADADGDLDLYVVSGSYEFEAGSEPLRDRLYLNDGSGKFEPASSDTLPKARNAGGPVVAADFDRDGDLDLFVGGRLVPGEYPLPARSQLLRNDDGKFVDVTEELAPALVASGLVTSALWSDANNDGWLDLLVTHEWGPVKLFGNEQGKLIDHTSQAKLDRWTGWFNGITGGDLDGDGDIDYVVTNFGLNTKYHASQKKPALLYYGDFSGDGTKSLVEAEIEDKTLFPVRGKSCSTRAMPHLADRFQTYNDFALASLADIYTPQCLQQSHVYRANTLESGVLLNDGQAHFTFNPLPRIAQISPAFGVVVTEIDGDGRPDVVLAQNFFTPQPETGSMDGGLSQLLLGNGDGTFYEIPPGRSGLIVSGDAKGLARADLNADGRPDLVVGLNNGPLATLESRAASNHACWNVKLVGPRGNPTAVGARVSVRSASLPLQTQEVHAGSGYLSQSSPILVFGAESGESKAEIEVRWPGGETTKATPTEQSDMPVVIRHP